MTTVLDLTDPDEIAGHYLADERPVRQERPWITMGMISSLDGSATLDGGSTALGGPPDRAVFRALRAVADVILVGASTVRSERYRSVRLPDRLVAWRRNQGLSEAPRLAIVSAQLGFDPTDSLLDSNPILVTCEAAPSPERSRWASRGDVLVAGEERVDLDDAMRLLRTRFGTERVTLEGGPTLNGQMVGQVDEISITLAPTVVAGDGPRIIRGLEGVRSAALDRVIHCDGFLLLRYLLG
ncbi:MAG TPA: dihydrofolate reductase family protein [Acidimicrobiia bacterium]|nr:dihydrofolate reductase family protein [Acidimicrobiia bacterium]